MEDTTVYVNDTLLLHASANDTNGSIKKFVWTFDAITFDTTTDSINKKVWKIVEPGQKIFLVKAIDEDGLVSDIDSTHINVLLGAPKIHAMNDTVIHVNDSLILHVSATDTNGTIKSYLWSFDNVNWDSTTGSYKKSYWPVSNYGKKVLYVKAIDDDGIVSNIDSSVIMVHLIAPVINTITDTVVPINDTLILHANATDSNGTISKFVWTTDGKSYDTTITGSYKTFWPLSFYGQKSDFLKALETEGIIQKNDSIFRGVAQVYAIDNDGIHSKVTNIILKFHLYKPMVKAMSDTSVAVNDSFTLHASGTDTNGTIKQYLWSLDKSTFDTTDRPQFKTIWSPNDFGIKKLFVKVIDDDGLVSDLDSTRITVHQYAPVVFTINDFGRMKDTAISFADSLYVPISATDTNGEIAKYYWDIGADGWNDSALAPQATRFIKYSSGGYITIVVGAKDDDGIMGTDSFHVLFNRPPTSCGLKTDYNADKGGWSDFNYSTNTGSIQVSFTGEDPDFPHDNLKYDLYWGTDQNNLEKKYTGPNTIVSISDIPIQTQFCWKVVARDLYKDSIFQTGTYSSPIVPLAGIFWIKQIPTTNINHAYNSGDYGYYTLMSTMAFEDKMWLISSNLRNGNNFVYNSSDGSNWTLVSQSANFKQAYNSGDYGYYTLMSTMGYQDKMWLISSNLRNGNNFVYNSSDGSNWTLVSQSANFKQAYNSGDYGYYTLMSTMAYQDKMWLISSNLRNGNNFVYNSTDGTNWILVSQSANFKQAYNSGDYGYYTLMSTMAYQDKMWLISSNLRNGNNFVYNSTDGTNWTLISQSANFNQAYNSGDYGYYTLMSTMAYQDKMWLISSNLRNGNNYIFTSK
jgi:hypothetical protein